MPPAVVSSSISGQELSKKERRKLKIKNLSKTVTHKPW
jgi:hypothetical protein